jgi:glucose-6-phosphate isomerase
MKWTNDQLWARYKKNLTEYPELGLALDLSRMNFPDDYFAEMAPRMALAFQAMEALERGAIANPDEGRRVGHYWLRTPSLAPCPELGAEITCNVEAIKEFAAAVHAGRIRGHDGPFANVLLIGIGGSALGPQFVAGALGHPATDKLRLYFLDNTDPDGFDRVLAQLQGQLGRTLCLVVSKSGSTPETQNGLAEVKKAYGSLDFAGHAVAITMEGSKLAKMEKWLRQFPMWDWVGGRTSELSGVGLLPAALQGVNIDELLAGARACDAETRRPDLSRNPAARLALMWHYAGRGRGEKDMVILPYKDRLELFSRYLQQLIMESLGKEVFLNGRMECQGIAVYGNKGSTDQHAYVQQLREGIPNFFVTFIEVLKDRNQASPTVDAAGNTSGDYLNGFLLGTRQALYENGRESVTLTIQEVSPFSVGVLIALYERAVGFYASLVHINAYHQPGVEAGKQAAGTILKLKAGVADCLRKASGPLTAEQIAREIGAAGQAEHVFKICEHLAANPGCGIRKIRPAADTPSFNAAYQKV